MIAFVVALLLSGSVPTTIKPEIVSGWIVSIADGYGCMATTTRGPSRLILSYDLIQNESIIAVSSSKFKSLKDGERVLIKILFLKGEKVTGRRDGEWVTTVKEGSPPSFGGSFRGDETLKLFETSDIVAFIRGEVPVDGFDLAGSSLVITSLRKCAAAREIENPSDPFAN